MKKNRLLARWLNNELSKEELAVFEASPDFATYQKIKKYTDHLEVADMDANAMLSTVLSHKKAAPNAAPKVVPLYRKWIYGAVAILVVALGISLALSSERAVAGYGEKTAFLLPDQSEVLLNSGSEISYKSWNWKLDRQLELKGEAYFKVSKGNRFEVQTDLGTVRVLGTQFNVKARKNRFEVVCYQGKVRVDCKNAEVLLNPGQSVIFEKGNRINIHTQSQKPEWMENKICFYKEDINALLEELQRQYAIRMELDAKGAGGVFTGSLPADDLDVALQIISTTYNLQAKKITKNKVIFSEK